MRDQLTIATVALGDLVADPANARRHDQRNLDAIRGSLARFGQVEPIVVQKGTRRIIGGHGRVEALRAMGETRAAVVEINVDNTEATALAIALNRTAELASWDDDALASLLESLPGDLADIAGFNQDELGALLDALAPAPDVVEDEVPQPPDDPVTRPGELIILGQHRLLCGDSASAEDVDRLLDGARIQLVNSDPPYNVRVEPRSNNAIAAGNSSFSAPKSHHQKFDLARHPKKSKPTSRQMRAKDRPLVNDFVSDEAFAELLMAWFGNMARVLEPGRAFYIWGGYANTANYPPALKANGLYFSQSIIWDKQHPVLTRKDFMGAHEWCFYGWREGAAHQFFGPANIPDLWAVKKVNPTAMVHLTEKPVELAARAMQYSSKKGENVLDLFGGSGSTLMAAEQTGRRAYLMEIDPAYCDVIVQRWETFTGGTAERHPPHSETPPQTCEGGEAG